MADDKLSGSGQSRLMRYFALHRTLFLVCLSVLFAVNWLIEDSGWFFWLALVWVMGLVIHFCIVKSIDVDEDWADERAMDLRTKSYDLKHINAIRGRYIKPRRRQSYEKKPDS